MTLLTNILSIASCLLLTLTNAQYSPNEFCFRACELALANSVQFDTTDPISGDNCTARTCPCTNGLSIASLYLCIRQYCTNEEIRLSVISFNESCQLLANVTAPGFQEVLGRYSDEDVLRLRHLFKHDTIAWPGPWPIVNEAVIVEKDLHELAVDTLVRSSQTKGS